MFPPNAGTSTTSSVSMSGPSANRSAHSASQNKWEESGFIVKNACDGREK